MAHVSWPVREQPRDLAFVARGEECEEARTVEHAFTRCGFSGDEWLALQDSPLRAFLWVATADGPVRPREREACRRVLDEGLSSPSPLVGYICGESLRQLDVLGPERLSESPDLELLHPLVARVAERLGLGEASRFQRYLLDVGWRVARASNGLLGLVGQVRGEERLALEALAETLGLQDLGG
ncbi:hypothetical protein [Archangium sp.]|uniref:hypothetical protein n=1 Tax=Archangium sp. TaxID=1872627 RepID=UPI002D2F78C0|nr:hypothetical protein [Archangium sp.]HYO59307.1 hypothetical protein [Archangium sp.]